MATPPKVDFSQLMSQIERFQAEIGEIHASLESPRQKAVLGEALQRVEEARRDTLIKYPAALRTIEESCEQSQARAAEAAARGAVLQQKYTELAASPPPKPEPPKPPQLKFDAQLGQRLRGELLARIEEQPPSDELLPGPREIWQDWD